jgi:hypothetical protein
VPTSRPTRFSKICALASRSCEGEVCTGLESRSDQGIQTTEGLNPEIVLFQTFIANQGNLKELLQAAATAYCGPALLHSDFFAASGRFRVSVVSAHQLLYQTLLSFASFFSACSIRLGTGVIRLESPPVSASLGARLTCYCVNRKTIIASGLPLRKDWGKKKYLAVNERHERES